MKDWNPDMYLQFSTERTQPSIDLIGRIKAAAPGKIIDIGCGPGNSTQVLVNRWPDCHIVGLDRSKAMIEKARRDYPQQQWMIADALTYTPEVKYDIVFSNAVIQWISDHAGLLERFHGMLSDRGLLAVQLPLFLDMPFGRIVRQVAQESRWKARTAGVAELLTIHAPSFYYDQLSGLFPSVDLWETRYFHIMEGHDAILKMMRSTGLKPYLERLDDADEKSDFEAAVLKEIKISYPMQLDGSVLFPFHRLFFIGYK